MVQNITIPKKEMELINDLLRLTGPEIYQKYGYKRDETITHTAQFPDGIEVDIQLIICEDDKPYTQGVMFHNGNEIAYSDCEETYDGEWIFEYNKTEYTVNVTVE